MIAKTELRKIKHDGYKWIAYDSDTKLYTFERGNYQDKFTTVSCFESELYDGSLELLIRLGMTR